MLCCFVLSSLLVCYCLCCDCFVVSMCCCSCLIVSGVHRLVVVNLQSCLMLLMFNR